MTVLFYVGFVAGLVSLHVTPAHADDLAELVAAGEQYDASFAIGRYGEALAAAKKMLAIVNRSFADKPKMMAACLERLAMAYHRDGKNAEAEPIQKRVLAMYDELYGREHVKTAIRLSRLAEMTCDLGRYGEAEALYQRSLRIQQNAPTPNDAALAEALRGYGMLFFDQRQYNKAEPLFLRAFAIREMTVDADLAQSLNDLALVYDGQARYQQAEEMYHKALAIYEKLNHSGVGAALDNLAGCYERAGKQAEAESFYLRALKTREAFGGPDSLDLPITLNNLAVLYMRQDRNHEAEPLYQRALSIHERALSLDHPYVARSLESLGIFYANLGRFADAEPLLRRALAIREKTFGPDNLDVADTLIALAITNGNQNRTEEAISLSGRALDIERKALGADHPKLAYLLDFLAEWQGRQQRYAEAESLCKQAQALSEAAHGPDHADVVRSIATLAGLYRAQGRLADAESLYERALRMREMSLTPEHSSIARTCVLLADCYCQQERFSQAEPFADRAVRILGKQNDDPGDQFAAYEMRARIALHFKRYANARHDLERALDLADQARVLGSGSEHDRASYFSRFAGPFETLVSLHAERDTPDNVFRVIERSRSRSLLDQIELRGRDLLVGIRKDQAAALRERQTAAKVRLASLNQQSVVAASDVQPSADERDNRVRELAAKIAESQAELLEVYRDICNQSPAYRLSVGRGYEPPKISDVQAALASSGSLLLEYFVGTGEAYVCVIPASGKPRVVQLKVDDELAGRLKIDAGPLNRDRLRQAMTIDGVSLPELLSGPDSAPRAFRRLGDLWPLLVPEPERRALSEGLVKQLVVVPDGELALLPFETLVVTPGEPPAFLLDVGPPVHYAPSAAVWLNLIGRSSTGDAAAIQPVLTIGNPHYERTKSGRPAAESALAAITARSRYSAVGGALNELPFSGTESAWVADVFKKQGLPVAALRRELATENNVRGNVSGRRILHFACHGLADQTFGNYFGCLALTPGGRAGTSLADDGFLTMAEIYELNLQQCELAILSACQTNYGPQQKGEGVWGLSRGFLVAGAKRVVASNWLVDDEAAASLISVFCSDLAKAQGKGEVPDYAAALHRAKRWIRGQEKWSSPYYWGTFVLVGPN